MQLQRKVPEHAAETSVPCAAQPALEPPTPVATGVPVAPVHTLRQFVPANPRLQDAAVLALVRHVAALGTVQADKGWEVT